MIDIKTDLIEGDIIERINHNNGVYHRLGGHYTFSHYSSDGELLYTKEFPSVSMYVYFVKFIKRPNNKLNDININTRTDLIKGDIIRRTKGNNGSYHELGKCYTFDHYEDDHNKGDKGFIYTIEYPEAGMHYGYIEFVSRPSRIYLDESLFEVD